MRKVGKALITLSGIVGEFLVLFINPVAAQDDVNKLDFFNWKEELGDPKFLSALIDLNDAAGRVRFVLILVISIFVTIFIGVTVYGAFTWITAGDNEEKLQKAKKVIRGGLVGLGISFGLIAVVAIIASILGINITEIDLSALETST